MTFAHSRRLSSPWELELNGTAKLSKENSIAGFREKDVFCGNSLENDVSYKAILDFQRRTLRRMAFGTRGSKNDPEHLNVIERPNLSAVYSQSLNEIHR